MSDADPFIASENSIDLAAEPLLPPVTVVRPQPPHQLGHMDSMNEIVVGYLHRAYVQSFTNET